MLSDAKVFFLMSCALLLLADAPITDFGRSPRTPQIRMSKVFAALLLSSALAAADVTEPKTGIKFSDKGLSRLGVRYKGPIKVYAVGEYEDGTYELKMSYGVGAQKMTSALADALKPRCSDAASIEEFEACLLKGLPNGAPKGTKLSFKTGGGKLGVSVNGKSCGAVGSKVLSSAFANIYKDKNAVRTDAEASRAQSPLAVPPFNPRAQPPTRFPRLSVQVCSMSAVGDVEESSGGGLLTPVSKGALLGATVGGLIGKFLG